MSKLVAVTESGHEIHLKGEQLELRRGGRLARAIKLAELEQLWLFGAVEITHAAMMALLERGIDVVFLTRGGSFRGRLVGRVSRHVELRASQFRSLSQPQLSLEIAKKIVEAKIRNQRHLALRAQATLGDDALTEALAQLRILASQVPNVTSREELLGLEGSAARTYFGIFGKLLRNPLFSFTHRTRRPPRDPVNAVLSFGYVMLTTLVEGEVSAAGMDPMLGAFHQPEYGRPSLALDIVEEFRAPIVDAVTLRLINRRQLVPADFGSPSEALGEDQLASEGDDSGAVYLLERGRKIFIRDFLARLREEVFDSRQGIHTDWRGLIRHQVYRFAKAVKGEAPYAPFIQR